MANRTLLLTIAVAGLLWPAAAGSSGETAPAAPESGKVPIVYLLDLSSGQVLHEREADRRFMPASITKAMTLLVAFDMIAAGELSQDQSFPISDAIFAEWNRKGSTMFIPAGSTVAVDDLLRGIAAVSANDGAIVLAEGAAGSINAWVARMNARARELGMRNTHFGTPNGWPDEGKTFTTAIDLAKLGRALATQHPDLYARYFGLRGYRYNGIAQDNHDPISGRVEGADGIKTGFTNQAGHGFLGSAVRDGKRLIMVVASGETESARDQYARELIEWGFAAHDTDRLFDEGDRIAAARVQNGTKASVGLQAKGAVNATVPRGQGGAVQLTLHYEGPLKAPIEAGEKIAELEIAVGARPSSRIPLYAEHGVARAKAVQRVRNGLAGLLP